MDCLPSDDNETDHFHGRNSYDHIVFLTFISEGVSFMLNHE